MTLRHAFRNAAGLQLATAGLLLNFAGSNFGAYSEQCSAAAILKIVP